MEYAKISVLIVTYKQADVIGRNIESILSQREYGLKEIVICDDCSPDNNWDVIQEYVNKYPDLIRAYRNDQNLGIYGNSNKLVSLRGDSDLFCWIEGDDAMCEGFLMAVQEAIKNQNIDVNKRIAIFGNWKNLYPDGREEIFKNSAIIDSKRTCFSLYIRNQLSWRGSVFSKKVLDCFKPVPLDMGLNLAENLFDSQFLLNTEKAYYVDTVGTIYYSNIGISTLLDGNSSYHNEENVVKSKYLLDNFSFNREDHYWLAYRYYDSKLRMQHSLILFIKAVFCYIRSGKGLKGREFVAMMAHLFNIKRRKRF